MSDDEPCKSCGSPYSNDTQEDHCCMCGSRHKELLACERHTVIKHLLECGVEPPEGLSYKELLELELKVEKRRLRLLGSA